MTRTRLLAAIVVGTALLLAGMAAGAAAAPDPSNQTSFKLQGCQLQPGETLPIGGKFVCPDADYGSGNQGKLWNELDLVPFRLTADNSGGPQQTYAIAVTLDYKSGSATGYDVISAPEVNATLSDAGCAISSAAQQPTLDQSKIYRIITITQSPDAICVFDYYGRLALGAHLYPGSSLHASIAGQDLQSGVTGGKDISINPTQIEPQQLSKKMTATQGASHVWSITKSASPVTLDFPNTCGGTANRTAAVRVRIEWTKGPVTPGGGITVVTNVYAKNPAHRTITVTATDTIFSGTSQLETISGSPVDVPANTESLVLTHTLVVSAGTTNLNDIATATYTDRDTGVVVPGQTEARASATVQTSTAGDDTAVITDVETITGTGLGFSIDSTTAGSAAGTFTNTSDNSAYALGTRTTGSVTWASATQSASGFVEFNKTVSLDQARSTSGTLSDTATLTTSGGTTSAASATTTISAANCGRVVIDKVTDPAGSSQSFGFDSDLPGNATFSLTDAATPLGVDVTAGTYTVTETEPSGWTLTSLRCVDQNNAPDDGTVTGTTATIDVQPNEIVTCTFTNGKPVLRTVKTVAPTSQSVGGSVTYTIKVINDGGAPATTTVTDDYKEAFIDPGTTTPAGFDNGDTITWSNVTVAAHSTTTLSYTAKVIAVPTTGGGTGGCQPGTFPVVNTVRITGGTGGEATLCVNGAAVLKVSKSGCPTTVVPGGLLTYTISFGNTGLSPATNVKLVDTIPAGTQVASAGGGTVSGNMVTWNLGTLAPGASGTKKLVLQVTAANGSTLTNTVKISADNAAAVTNTATTPVSNAGAITHGSAYGADVNVLGLHLLNRLGSVATVAPGSPQVASNQLASIGLSGVASIKLVHQTSQSSITTEATSTATSTVTSVNLLGGAITADLIKSVSQSVAGPGFASSNSTGSTLANLKINGTSILNVKPNTTVDVKGGLLGLITIARVVIFEEKKSASFTNGKFTAKHFVNMIHVTVLEPLPLLGLGVGAEIILAHAESDATYPSGLACGATPGTVSGEAFTASVKGTFLGVPIVKVKVGDAVIGPLGGSDSDGAAVTIPGALSVIAAANTASGAISPSPNATAHSVVTKANVLAGLVTADALDVKSTSTATGTTANTTFAVTFLNLKVGGATISASVKPNTTIAVGQPNGCLLLVILNEQIKSTDGTKNTEGTVNAVHAWLLKGGIVSAEVIVASAHSDAHKP